MKKIRAMLFISIALVVALVRADPPTDPPADPNDEFTLPCDYYSARLPYIGGVMCPVLPGSPPPGCINDGICEYYWCDNSTACNSGSWWQKWWRTRAVVRTPGDPDHATYYTTGLTTPDIRKDCCHCTNNYIDPSG